ncbi:5-methylthioadenosine/S-adenosylhomocysteine deaminase [Clostridium tetanomorphum]|uniref:amidohydrolase n=1 Tax=Clostridium tetanomorphum TaxID=1553 RepID=UPI00044E0A76|nr:amidohydrolase [Clostridium tetanomorphum]KAJ53662.1 atrazine chlorohydrolase [Clostridium tetanomorphum DSM 665]MBP1862383.1 5-methylthioadenosine/S-adenosylhomocysteine deaminase [Clostridium tetanomorphum]NRS85777.1 5-methylthioadenosine/S-adenosylhomocysteine deaminase [Clostridium tetanomorphum]SQC02494.1 atrazine chlorohydrolase [Clostridium tetanomorphum]
MSILIKDTMIVTMDEDGKIIDRGYILIEDKIIKEISYGEYLGEFIEKYNDLEVIDGKGYCVMPGLINCHTHAAMTILRGYGEGLPLMRWLNERIWPMESKFKERHIKLGTEIACMEMIGTGTTCFNNMYFYEEEAIKVAEEFNIRAILGIPIIGDTWEETLKTALDFHKKVKRRNDNLIKTMLAPHSPYTLEKEALVCVGKEAKKIESGVHIHIGETEDEVNILKEKYNLTACELLLQSGIFKNKVVGAHCVHLTDEDIEILKENKASVVYNPQSNMKLASGVARIIHMLDKGINVCLGTDGTSSNNNLNMIEEMETGALLQKLWYKDATKLDGEEAVKMATINGAKALGINNLGIIKEGYLADLIMINLNKPNLIPNHNIHSNIVFSANGSEVEYVIINGKIIMRKAEFLNIDKERIMYEFKALCKEFKQ